MAKIGLFPEEIISKYETNMQNCRGWGYNNGDNMIVKQK